jgi:hypothetical protein
MRARNRLLILVLVIVISTFLLLLLAGCKEKAECKTNYDCNTGNECIIGKCVNEKCVQTPRANCCGNHKCEADSGENKCICSDDCGRCEGKATYNASTSRGIKILNATYAVYMCVNKECIVGVPPEKVNTLSLINSLEVSAVFKAETLTTINNPFDTSKDKASVRVTLKDLGSQVQGGITIKGIQVLDGSNLMGEAILDQKLSSVDDTYTQELSLKSAQSMVDVEKSIDLKIDFEYVIPERSQPVTKRGSLKPKLAQKVFFITQK